MPGRPDRSAARFQGLGECDPNGGGPGVPVGGDVEEDLLPAEAHGLYRFTAYRNLTAPEDSASSQTVWVTDAAPADAADLRRRLLSLQKALNDIDRLTSDGADRSRLEKIKPSIEDRFIQLMER